VKVFFLQCNAPKEIHSILTETLACFLPGRTKDLSASLYKIGENLLSIQYSEAAEGALT